MFQIFDKLTVKDTRIPQICAQSTESTPYEMLKLCVKKYDDLFIYLKLLYSHFISQYFLHRRLVHIIMLKT